MKPITSKFTEQIEKISQLLNQTLRGIFIITFVALAGIACYVIFSPDRMIPLGTTILGSGTLVIVCALCWLGFFSKRLLDIQNVCRKQLLETELSLYREEVRRDGLLQDAQTTNSHLDLKTEAKRKEIELAKLEKELKTYK